MGILINGKELAKKMQADLTAETALLKRTRNCSRLSCFTGRGR